MGTGRRRWVRKLKSLACARAKEGVARVVGVGAAASGGTMGERGGCCVVWMAAKLLEVLLVGITVKSNRRWLRKVVGNEAEPSVWFVSCAVESLVSRGRRRRRVWHALNLGN